MPAVNLIRAVVVDDSPIMLKAIVSALDDISGCEVVGTAADGADALEFARQEDPNLVVMDVNMPRLGGIAALKILRRDMPSVGVVMISTVMEPEVRETALQLGAIACIEKGPDFRHHLHAKIREAFPEPNEQSARTSPQGGCQGDHRPRAELA